MIKNIQNYIYSSIILIKSGHYIYPLFLINDNHKYIIQILLIFLKCYDYKLVK